MRPKRYCMKPPVFEISRVAQAEAMRDPVEQEKTTSSSALHSVGSAAKA